MSQLLTADQFLSKLRHSLVDPKIRRTERQARILETMSQYDDLLSGSSWKVIDHEPTAVIFLSGINKTLMAKVLQIKGVENYTSCGLDFMKDGNLKLAIGELVVAEKTTCAIWFKHGVILYFEPGEIQGNPRPTVDFQRKIQDLRDDEPARGFRPIVID